MKAAITRPDNSPEERVTPSSEELSIPARAVTDDDDNLLAELRQAVAKFDPPPPIRVGTFQFL
jgi:hypothetical protein